MSDLTYAAWLPGAMAELEREGAIPQPPLGYGTDLSCTEDLDPTFRLASGAQVVHESLIRELITPTGGLIDDPTYGAGIPELLSIGMTPQEIDAVGRAAKRCFDRDDRVSASKVVCTQDGETMLVSCQYQLHSSDRNFQLILSVDGTGAIETQVVES